MAVNYDDILHWMTSLREIYIREKQYLTDLDCAIGDGDHGINMERGFQAVKVELEQSRCPDIAGELKMVAMTLLRSVGGASGPLYASFLLRAGDASSGKIELQAQDVVTMFESGFEGIVHRGKAQQNDKTMVDTWIPAIQAMNEAMLRGKGLREILQCATSAAESGMKSTIPMQARKGRASYLGERSIGHQDPGATSSYWMIRAAAELWE